MWLTVLSMSQDVCVFLLLIFLLHSCYFIYNELLDILLPFVYSVFQLIFAEFFSFWFVFVVVWPFCIIQLFLFFVTSSFLLKLVLPFFEAIQRIVLCVFTKKAHSKKNPINWNMLRLIDSYNIGRKQSLRSEVIWENIIDTNWYEKCKF